MAHSSNKSSNKSKTHSHKTKLKNLAKSEGKKALHYYLLKFLSRRSHKSYFHRRVYQLLAQLLNRYLK